MHGAIYGCTVLGEVHPVSTQNKILISDTVKVLFKETGGIYVRTDRDIMIKFDKLWFVMVAQQQANFAKLF